MSRGIGKRVNLGVAYADAMAVEWADKRTPRVRVLTRLPEWPGTLSRAARAATIANGSLIGSFSHNHACAAWADARMAVAARAHALPSEHLEQVADLAMVTTLAAHLGSCSRCWRTGPYDSDTPVAWLTWAVARRPNLRKILEPVLAELSVSRAALASTPPLTR